MSETQKVVTEVVIDATAAQAEIIKLNTVASDTTKTFEERIKAKNLQATKQASLSKQNIANLQKEVTALEKAGASATKITAAKKKLNSETLKQVKADAASTKQLNKLEQQMAKAAKTSKTSATGMASAFSFLPGILGRVGMSMQAVGIAANKMLKNPILLAIAAVVALGAAFVSLVKGASEFQQKNAELASVLGTTRDKIDNLITSSLSLGKTTAFTAEQVTGLQISYSKLGFAESDIIQLSKATIDLSVASKASANDVATYIGSVVRIYGLSADEAERVANVTATAAASSALSFEKLSVQLPIVGVTAKQAGVELEGLVAQLGILSDRGIQTETAATSLRNIFLKSEKAGMNFAQAMKFLNNAENKNVAAMELFGVRGATMAVIMSETALATADLKDQLENTGPSVKKMADEQMNTLQGSTTLLKSAWDGFKKSLADGQGVLSKIAKGGIDFLTGSINVLSGAVELVKVGVSAFFNFFKIGAQQAVVIAAKIALVKAKLLGNDEDILKAKENLKAAEEAEIKTQEKLNSLDERVVAVFTNKMTAHEKLVEAMKRTSDGQKEAIKSLEAFESTSKGVTFIAPYKEAIASLQELGYTEEESKELFKRYAKERTAAMQKEWDEQDRLAALAKLKEEKAFALKETIAKEEEVRLRKLSVITQQELNAQASMKEAAADEAYRQGKNFDDLAIEAIKLRSQAELSNFDLTSKSKEDIEKQAAERIAQAKSKTGEKKEDIDAEVRKIQTNAELEIASIESKAEKRKEIEINAQNEIDQILYDTKMQNVERMFALDSSIAETELGRLEMNHRNTLDAELKFLKKKRDNELAAANLTADEIDAIKKKYTLADEKLTKKTEETKRDVKYDTIEDSAAALGGLFDYEKQIALAIAAMRAPQAIIDIWAKTGSDGILGPGMAALQTVTVLAPIIQGIKDITDIEPDSTPSTSSVSSVPSYALQSTADVESAAPSNQDRVQADQGIIDRANSSASSTVGNNSEIVFSESSYSEFKNQVSFKESKSSY